MSQARYIITKIRDFVNNEQQDAVTSEHELAEQFADLCRSFNERVHKVTELLEHGRRSEAVQEVMTPPSLLDLEELLDFPELKKWRNLCLDFGLVSAPELQMDAMDKIKEECAKEEYLEPLLKKFRRLVHEKKIDERIQVLRRIRQLDPENQVWQDNLAPLEKEQLKKLYQEVDAACNNDDYERLEVLYEDLRDPRRVVPADQTVVDKIEDKLAEKRAREAAEEGEAIWNQLKAAWQKEDIADCQDLLIQWWRLSQLDYFEPDEERKRTVEEIQKWSDEKVEETRKQNEVREEIERLDALMRRDSPNLEDLEKSWRRLNNLDGEIPDFYKTEVPRKITALREERNKRSRQKKLAVTVTVGLVIAAVSLAGLFFWRARQADVNYERLNSLLERERFEDVENELARLAEEEPGIYKAEKIREIRHDFDRTMQEREERQAEFADIASTLKSLRANDYQAEEDYIVDLLEEGLALAMNSEHERLIRQWEKEWRTWRKRRGQEAKNEFEELVSQLEMTIQQYANKDKGDIEEHKQQLQQAEETIARLQEIAPEVPEEEKKTSEKITALREEVQDWGKTVSKRNRKIRLTERERRKLIDNLDEYVTDISDYESRLMDFINRFPDAPESKDLRRARDELKAFHDVLALTGVDIPDFPVTENDGRQFADLRDRAEVGEESLWYRDLEKCVNDPGKRDEAVDVLDELRLSEMWDIKSISYKKPDEDEWRTVYCPDEFHSRIRTTAAGEEEQVFWGNAFIESENSYQPELEHIKLSDSEYDIRAGKRENDNLIPAARFARRLLGAVPEEGYMEDYLVEQLQEVLEDEDIEVVPKALIMRKIAQAIKTASSFELPALDKILDGLSSDLNYKVPWMNASNVKVRKEVDRIRDRVSEISPDLLKRIADSLVYNRWLHTAFLDRDWEVVGVVKKDLAADYNYPEMLTEDAGAVCGVVPARQRRPNQLYSAVEKNEDGEFVFTEEGKRRAYLGQLLFGWSDGKGREGFLDQGPRSPEAVDIDFPNAWPRE